MNLSNKVKEQTLYTYTNLAGFTPKKIDAPGSPAHYAKTVTDREKTRHYFNVLANTNILGFRPGPVVVSIGKTGPTVLIENRAAWVEFEIWNRAGAVLENCFVRIRIDPRQSIDGYPGSFEYRINKLEAGESIISAISFQLPRADYDNLLTVELCQVADEQLAEIDVITVLAKDELYFDVGARFSINMGGIWIMDTASRHNDSVHAGILGLADDGSSWDDAVFLGDHNNTSPYGLHTEALLAVGPFDMMPRSGKVVTVSVTITNQGHTSEEEDARVALKVVSAVGAKIATAVMSVIFPVGAPLWAGLSEGADQLHQAIIEFALKDCDTVVLSDTRTITENDLFDATGPGDNITQVTRKDWVFSMQKRAGTMISEFLGGGCRDSSYSTTIVANRFRLPESFHGYQDDGVLLAPDQIVSFRQVFADNPKVFYSFEGDGKMDINGNYKAPHQTTTRKFAIIKWRTELENKRGPYTASEDFTLVLLT